MQSKVKKKASVFPSSALKGAVWALIITIISVLGLAFIVKEAELTKETISIINQVIKIAAISAAGLIASGKEHNTAAASLSGVMYIVFSFAAFSIIEGEIGNIKKLFLDILMGMAIGAIVSLISGSLGIKKKSK